MKYTTKLFGAATVALGLSAFSASAATLSLIGDIGKIQNLDEITVGDVKTPLLYKCNTDEDLSACVGEPGKSPTSSFDGTLQIVMADDLASGKFRVTDIGTKDLPHYIGIKGGPTNSLLYEITGDLSEWTLFSNSDLPDRPSGAPPAISNITFWNTGDSTVIPLPAGAWLMLTGIAGFAAMRRRRKAA